MTSTTDYAVPTGDFILEWMEDHGLSQAEMARRLGVSPKHVSKLLTGASLTPEVATKLELVTGIAARIWLSYEATYRADVARLAMTEEVSSQKELARLFPLTQLRKLGRTEATMRTPGVAVMELLAFFQVGSVKALQAAVSRQAVAYRQGTAHTVDEYALATWLRLGEIEAALSDVRLAEYDAKELKRLLPALRACSVDPKPNFGQTLVESLAAVGVRLIFVAEIKGARMYGATRWIQDRPVIALTARGRDDGQFWFTLFHELGHVLLHQDHRTHIRPADADAAADPAELQANAFASEVLIPKNVEARLAGLRSKTDVVRFAREIGVSPGVVVGRLWHDKLWDYTNGHGLCLRLSITD
jgi:HTH-type transcriptional regulator/antitoxin HigA